MLFALAAALLTLIVAAALVRPLLRERRPPPGPGRFNAAVYRDQLEELRLDAERDGADPAQAAAARLEIERRLVSAARDSAPEAAPRRAPRALALALVALLFLGAGGVYLAVGSPLSPDQPLAASRKAQAAEAGQADAEMSRMVDLLARRLAADPDHWQGWALLARSEMRLDRPGPALQAYARALRLRGADDPDLDREYAQARVTAAGGRVDAEARTLFARLLAARPGDPQARYELALAKAQSGDLAGGLADLRALVKDSPPDVPWLPLVRQRLTEATAQPSPPSTELKGAARVGSGLATSGQSH